MTDACDRCLRRSHLVAFLAGDVQRLLPRAGPARAEPLEAHEETLIAALPEPRRAAVRAFLQSFRPQAARTAVAAAGLDSACRHSEEFPACLHELRRPPDVLYATSLAGLRTRDPGVVVVGSRRPSEYGRTVAFRLGRGVGGAGVPVVSGLALGIDAVAHRGCLDARGRTVAVLASGADVPYPRTNRLLYERIRESGAVVSEMPPGSRPYRWLFPARNRIMAALGQLTVVVEATQRSGTLITADCAAELGRDVAAVPGRVTSEAATGTNGLLRSGAALVTNAQDVLDLLFGAGARTAAEPPPPELDQRERAVLELVASGAALDELGARTRLPAGAVRSTLARLEARGLIRRARSGSYVPAA